MKALLLAAGEGTRLRPFTLQRPKPMLPLGGKPILEHLVAQLRDSGVTEIAVNLHYQPQAVVDYFGDGRQFGVTITYSHEEHLLGSAGAVKALDWFLTDPFFVLYGDVLSNVDLRALRARHADSGAVATLSLHEVPDPWRCGIVTLDPAGWITRFIEKPAPGTPCGNLANSGIYLVQPEVVRWIPAGGPFDFGRDLFPRLLEMQLPLLGFTPGAYVVDIGSPERYAQAEADLQSGRFRSCLFAPGVG
jgi:NDP-sugar pyrophosphorylase family protein